MATTIAIAASFNIDPEKLESWATGEKPSNEAEAKIAEQIFESFDYVDGDWRAKTEPEAKKAKTKKTTKTKKKTKAAVSTPSSTADQKTSINTAVSITSVDSSQDKVKAETAKNEAPAESDLKSTQVESDSTSQVAEKPTESSSKETDKAASTEPTEGSNDKESTDKATEEPKEPTGPKVLFSAVGIIRGEVTIDEEENQHTVKFGGKTYPLFYARKNYTAFTGLKKEIEASGNANQRLIVYPKFTHFPKRDQLPRVGFQLVGFDKGGGEGVTQELNDNEFKICGLWQFIPVCRQPCISIFRNFTRDRLDYIKQAETRSKVNFMKASHLPILWRDGPVKPFRFNPKLKKEEQAKVYFVEIKAKFLPQRDCFGFSEMLGEPLEKLPRFLKASKADKAEVMKKAGKNKPPGKGGNAKPAGKGKPQNKVIVKPKSSPKPTKPIKKES